MNKHGFEFKMSSKALLTYSLEGLASLNRGTPARIAFISDDSWKFFQYIACEAATHVMIARLRSKRDIIGWFRFTPDKKSKYIHAQGTWVDEQYRRLGIGMSLWDRVIAEKSPSEISVMTTSNAGRALVSQIKRRHPQILFFR